MRPPTTRTTRASHWLLVVLVLTACLASLARAAATDDAEVTKDTTDRAVVEDPGDEDGDVDFPDDDDDLREEAVQPPRRALPTPVSVYVLRLLEILTGAETFGKHTRYTRASRQDDGYPYADPPEAGRVNTAASYSNYYDFLINEGSYKFWAVFQIGTAILLVYSAFAALYYARYTYYTNVDYTDYDDYFFRRSGGSSRTQRSTPFKGLSSTEYQRVMDAVEGAKFKPPASPS